MGGRSSLRNKSYLIKRKEKAGSNGSVFFMHISNHNHLLLELSLSEE